MTDKQINYEQNSVIIDGCDVSGCECYSEHREGYCGWHTPCEGDTCPYKLKWALQQFKRKEQELEMICKTFDIEYIIDKETGSLIARSNKLQKKEQECERLAKGYAELTEIISPYMDDFTGYNEEFGGFDIVLCVKELMEQLDQLKEQNEQLTNKLKKIIEWRHNYCINCEDLLKSYKSCEGCYMTELKYIAEE